MADRKKRAAKRQQEFYETMPGTMMQPFGGLERLDQVEQVEDHQEEAADTEVRGRMVRQLVTLVALLIIQFILFAVLLQSTINLG
jgi:hypothetical protein